MSPRPKSCPRGRNQKEWQHGPPYCKFRRGCGFAAARHRWPFTRRMGKPLLILTVVRIETPRATESDGRGPEEGTVYRSAVAVGAPDNGRLKCRRLCLQIRTRGFRGGGVYVRFMPRLEGAKRYRRSWRLQWRQSSAAPVRFPQRPDIAPLVWPRGNRQRRASRHRHSSYENERQLSLLRLFP